MHVVFMGTPDFAVPTLKALLESSHQVVGVVTRPDKPRGRGLKVLPPPVKVVAESRGLPVLQPLDLKEAGFLQALRAFRADVFVVVAFLILPPEVFEIPPKGTINLHASLLPKFRGAAPIQWALINGEKETGVTTFFIERQVDTGNILLQEKMPIAPEDTFGTLHDKLAALGARVVVCTLDLLEAGALEPKPQTGQVTRAPKIKKEDRRINWEQPAEQIVNRIRGLSPVPGAFSFFRGKLIKVYRAQAVQLGAEKKAPPGTIGTADPKAGLVVQAGERGVKLLELQPEGKRPLSAADFLRGYRVKPGERFTSER